MTAPLAHRRDLAVFFGGRPSEQLVEGGALHEVVKGAGLPEAFDFERRQRGFSADPWNVLLTCWKWAG